MRSISVTYEDGNKSFEGFAALKVQGSSSLSYDKKNYTITFFNDNEHSEPLSVDVGWGAQTEYCLKANWIDKTHARNVVTANLVTEVQKKYDLLSDAPANGAVDGFPIEIYINDEFLGIYTFNIPKGDWQFGMDSNNPNHLVFGGEKWDDSTFFIAETTWEAGSWELEVGEETDEALQNLNALIRFISTSTDEEFRSDFEQHMSLDAALNYYVLMDFAYLPDNGAKNMLLATYDGVEWYPSLYDLDTSWGADYDGKSILNYAQPSLYIGNSKLVSRLIDLFPTELAARYTELRQSILTPEHVMNLFNKFEASIPEESFAKEVEKWGENIPGFDISQIETYLDIRIPILDQKYAELGNP